MSTCTCASAHVVRIRLKVTTSAMVTTVMGLMAVPVVPVVPVLVLMV